MAKKIFLVLMLVVLVFFAIYYWYNSSQTDTDSTNVTELEMLSEEARSKDLFERAAQSGLGSEGTVDELQKSQELFNTIQQNSTQ